MKDGRTHLAHKAEVDLETGAIGPVTSRGRSDNGACSTPVLSQAASTTWLKSPARMVV